MKDKDIVGWADELAATMAALMLHPNWKGFGQIEQATKIKDLFIGAGTILLEQEAKISGTDIDMPTEPFSDSNVYINAETGDFCHLPNYSTEGRPKATLIFTAVNGDQVSEELTEITPGRWWVDMCHLEGRYSFTFETAILCLPSGEEVIVTMTSKIVVANDRLDIKSPIPTVVDPQA